MVTREFFVRVSIPVVPSQVADDINANLRSTDPVNLRVLDQHFPGVVDALAEVATRRGVIPKNRLDFAIKACREEMHVSNGRGFLTTEFGVWTGSGFVSVEDIAIVP